MDSHDGAVCPVPRRPRAGPGTSLDGRAYDIGERTIREVAIGETENTGSSQRSDQRSGSVTAGTRGGQTGRRRRQFERSCGRIGPSLQAAVCWSRTPHKDRAGDAARSGHGLEDRFRSCGSRDFFTLGTDFDWHRNAIDDKEWLLHLQWHHVLRTLVEAGAMRRDPRYTAKAVELLRDWIPKNLPGAPWSWRTLEVSLRAMNWTTIYPFLVAHDGFTRQDHVDVLFTLAEHLDYLLPPERFHSGHNFGASESRALLRVGTAMPEFKNAQKWRETAWERFQGEMAAQVLEDGAQVELTTGYHCGVTNSLTAAALEMRRLGTEPPSAYWNRLERMYEYSLLLTKPDGTQPSLGDSWGGRPLSFIRKGGELFERPDMVFVASNGKEGERPGFLDTRLPAAGYYVMRTSWTDNPNGIYLLLDAAHHWGGWHQHYDALGIVLYAYGKTLTPDAGPFAYDSPQRPVFQGTPAHSTLTVDEANQNTSPCVLHAMTGDSRLGIIDASQTGYAGVTHRRQVLFIRPTAESAPYVVLVDRVTGEGDHVLDLHFHLQESPVVTSQEQMSTRTVVADSANILTQAIWQHGVEFRPGSSWIMTGYGEKADRPDVVFRQTGSLPKAFVTLLIPTEDASAPRIAARVLGQPDVTGAIGVEVKAPWGTDTVQVGLQVGSMRVDGIEATARAVLHRADGKGTVMCRTILGE
ncbi:MAG: alginate lyase family protein [Lentisphaerae bacterium]|nr:alginate lyase family protein [Lentisphaerota bacterium]